MLTDHPIKTKIRKTAIITLIPCCVLIIAAFDSLRGNTLSGAAFLFLMAICANLTGLICLMVLIAMIVHKEYTKASLFIIISTHTAIWGIVWVIAMSIAFLIGEVEDKVPLFFIFPSITGSVSFAKIFKSITDEGLHDPKDNNWPPVNPNL